MEVTSISDNLVLSICIPTYNRLPFLAESLSAVICQVNSELAPFVEVVISDNASSDGTDEYVEKVINTYPHLQIRYFCNEENLGLDMNIYRVTKEAKAKWTYIISDDDIFLQGGLFKLLSLIKEHPNLDAFCLNTYGFETDPYKVGAPIFNISKDTIFQNKDDSLLFLGRFGITFITTIVFRSEIIRERDHLDKIGTLLRHSYSFLDALSKENGLYVVQECFIASRVNNSGGYSFFKVFISNFYKVMIYARDLGYSHIVINKILIEHFSKFIPSSMVSFKMNQNNNNKFETLKIKELTVMLFKLCLDIPVLLPNAILTILLFVVPKKALYLLMSLDKK